MSVFKRFWLILLTVIPAACDRLEDGSQAMPPEIYNPPVYCALNTSPGYSTHPVKGEPVKPLVTPTGDTLISGVPVELDGKLYVSSELQQELLKAGNPRVIDFQSNRYPLSDRIKIVPLNSQNVHSFEPPQGLSTSGDSGDRESMSAYMRTPVKLVDIPSRHPKPTPASIPEFRESHSHNIRHLDVKQGMNSSRINGLIQDNRGDLWFGTHGGGVTRYNGETFRFYTTEHGLNDNIIRSIYEDSKGNIWFITWTEGISIFDGRSFFDLSTNELLADQGINAIVEDRQGNIWLGSETGICKYDGSELTCISELSGLSLDVTSIIETKDGLLWFGTHSIGLVSYDGNEFTRYSHNEGLSSDDILSLLEDNQGHIWIGANDQGLCRFDGSSFIYYSDKEGFNARSISALLEDSHGDIWIGTNNDGLFKFNGEWFTGYTTREGLSDNTINSIIEDRDHQIWVGTKDGGVNVVKQNSFVHLTSLDQLDANHIRAIQEDGSGNYWFTSWGGGVIYNDGQKLYQYTTKQGLPDNTIWDMCIDEQDRKWFGGAGGLTMFDGSQFLNLLPNFHILSLLQDQNGTFWIGTAGKGLLRYDGDKLLQYSAKEGFNGDNIWSMTEDKQGNLWIATWGGNGVAKYDGTHFTFYTEKEGLIHSDIWSVMEDRRGNMWFGSYGEGISVFDGNGFLNITKSHGLPNNIVSSMIEDQDGNIWIGTENGLSRLEFEPDQVLVRDQIDELGKFPFRIINYSRNDGLIAEDFNVHSVYLDSRDQIWWGTGKSLVRLNLRNHQEENLIASASLVQIEIRGMFLDYGLLNDSTIGKITYGDIPAFSNLPNDLIVPYQQNHLTFHFTTNNIAFPHQNLYSYKIPGASDFWSPATDEAKADYRNIPYGEHKILISAAGSDKQWSQPMEYSFTVLPPWWQTWWARIAYIILGITFITGIIRWRTANIKKKQKILERLVVERTAEVVEQKKRSDELLLNILPANVARELKETGKIEPVHFEEVSILFADFKEFTNIVASIPSKKLIYELNDIFQSFDDIVEKRGLEKIQTVGDAYLAAGGLPDPDPEHARKCVVAAKDMIDYLSTRNQQNSIKWKVRIGIHSGPITAGVVGKKKFAYDVFGDTVNVAARIESASDEGRINISAYTHDLIKSHFICEYRGKINAKGKGDLDMYFVNV